MRRERSLSLLVKIRRGMAGLPRGTICVRTAKNIVRRTSPQKEETEKTDGHYWADSASSKLETSKEKSFRADAESARVF